MERRAVPGPFGPIDATPDRTPREAPPGRKRLKRVGIPQHRGARAASGGGARADADARVVPGAGL